jgi:hypothetical protein
MVSLEGEVEEKKYNREKQSQFMRDYCSCAQVIRMVDDCNVGLVSLSF